MVHDPVVEGRAGNFVADVESSSGMTGEYRIV